MPTRPTSIEAIPNRHFDLDWLRVILIMTLFFHHVGSPFHPWGWLIKNNETTENFHDLTLWMMFWRMPLLAFISGAGTYLAMGKRSIPEYIRERIKKLFIPLLFGMFTFIPPQTYYSSKHIYDSYWEFYKTIFDFVFYPEGNFGWLNMWFIAYVLVFSILATPLLSFLLSSKSENFRHRMEKVFSRPIWLLLIPAALLLATQFLLRPYFPNDTFKLLNDWALFTLYFLFFLFGLFCYSSETIRTSIGKNRKYLLLAGLMMSLLYGVYRYTRKIYHFPWSDIAEGIQFDVLTIPLIWFTILVIIAYGQQYLNYPNRLLPKLTEAVYPFFLLLQPLIVIIAYYICQLDWSITLKFWSIALLAMLSFAGIYFLIIRPFNVMRFFFGLKLKKRENKLAVINL